MDRERSIDNRKRVQNEQVSKGIDKQDSKQKVVFVRDKCRFGLDVHSLIALKHGRHISKQGSCMDM